MSVTDPSQASTPQEYIEALPEPRRAQVLRLHEFIRTTFPDLKPFIERAGMIGYGSYHYRYDSGREGDSCIVGLASRKNYISVYAMGGDGNEYVAEKYKAQLPKADIGKSCIRFKRVDDIDFDVLAKILKESEQSMEPLKNP